MNNNSPSFLLYQMGILQLFPFESCTRKIIWNKTKPKKNQAKMYYRFQCSCKSLLVYSVLRGHNSIHVSSMLGVQAFVCLLFHRLVTKRARARFADDLHSCALFSLFDYSSMIKRCARLLLILRNNTESAFKMCMFAYIFPTFMAYLIKSVQCDYLSHLNQLV